MITVRRGDRGRAVTRAQRLLLAAADSPWVDCLGEPYIGERPLVADGMFGRVSRQATIAFQARRGLETDGVIGPLTWAELERFAETMGPPEPPPSTVCDTRRDEVQDIEEEREPEPAAATAALPPARPRVGGPGATASPASPRAPARAAASGAARGAAAAGALGQQVVAAGDPDWLRRARAEERMGVSERTHEERIRRVYIRTVTPWRENETNDFGEIVDWCGVFVKWCLGDDLPGPAGGPAGAARWRSYGEHSERRGAICVGESWKPRLGRHGHHVGFLLEHLGETATQGERGQESGVRVRLLGGNQNDSVCEKEYDFLRIWTRWPPGV